MVQAMPVRPETPVHCLAELPRLRRSISSSGLSSDALCSRNLALVSTPFFPSYLPPPIPPPPPRSAVSSTPTSPGMTWFCDC